jgi:hypothetical protein
MRPAEHEGRRVEIARGDGGANGAAAHRSPADVDRRDDLDLEAELAAHLSEFGGVPLATAPETGAVTDDDRARRQPIGQHLACERARVDARESRREALEDNDVDRLGRQELQALSEGRQGEWCAFRSQDRSGMRMKRERNRRQGCGAGAAVRRASTAARVHAVGCRA